MTIQIVLCLLIVTLLSGPYPSLFLSRFSTAKVLEHNLDFAIENEWISDLSSFYAETPSGVFIEAIEPAVLFQIARPDLIYLYANYPCLNSTFGIIVERKYIDLQNRVLQNISATAEERYHDFATRSPSLAARLPNTQVASYLGITPEFLSKIRKELAHKR